MYKSFYFGAVDRKRRVIKHLYLSCPSEADMSINNVAPPRHFRQKMKKDDGFIVFYVGAVDGT